ncbi:MAG: tetratricopeptide repeat protein [Terriglobales bacterium]
MSILIRRADLKAFLSRASVIFTILFASAVLAFLGASHLVNRFREQEKALGRHLYAQGLAEQASGKTERAIAEYRAALTYDRDNFQYQLSLARALRDSGLTSEAKTYLMNLWERNPEDGAVNLALGRLAAREGAISEAIHYYHNATYGVWDSDAEVHRRDAEFELINFLLQQNALPQAQGELITFSASLPREAELEMPVARMFDLAGDQERALAEYEAVLRHDRQNAAALAGAGREAFKLHHYRTAEKYLGDAAKLDPRNAPLQQSLEIARLVLQADPFSDGLSNRERSSRVRDAFNRAGELLAGCAKLHNISFQDGSQQENAPQSNAADVANSFSTDLASLHKEWLEMKLKLRRPGAAAEADTADSAMALVFKVEEQTQNQCGEPTVMDRALLELAQNPQRADQ